MELVWKIAFHSILEIFHYSIPKLPIHSIPFFIPYHALVVVSGMLTKIILILKTPRMNSLYCIINDAILLLHEYLIVK